jgi:prepilin-type N-terminal cleavage/methylation domain-containing protein
MRSAQTGFTLIELLVALSIMVALLLSLAPFASDWVHSSQTRDARAKLILAYGVTKGAALRNPQAIQGAEPAASLKITTDGTTTTLLACACPSSDDRCTVGGNMMVWMGTYPSSVATTLNGVLLTASRALALELSNRSERVGASSFTLSRGNSSNDEIGDLE